MLRPPPTTSTCRMRSFPLLSSKHPIERQPSTGFVNGVAVAVADKAVELTTPGVAVGEEVQDSHGIAV